MTHEHISKPNPKHLDFWGCNILLETFTLNPQATLCYSDGSKDPNNNNPSAMVFVPDSHNNTIRAATPPIKGSYPGEIYAIIISLLYTDINLLPQPLKYAIGNLTTCYNLNLLLSSFTFPFEWNNNSFYSWYHLLWHLLKNLDLPLTLTWIKGHASFEGDDVANTVSKCIYTVSKCISSHIHVPVNHLTPPDVPSILYHNTPPPGKITTKHTKHL